MNQFYQSVRGSDVAYVTTDTRNPRTMLWSTSPTNKQARGASLKKDIATMPKPQKKSKVFRGYSNQNELPADQLYSSKQHTDARKGRYLADLQKKLLDNSST